MARFYFVLVPHPQFKIFSSLACIINIADDMHTLSEFILMLCLALRLLINLCIVVYVNQLVNSCIFMIIIIVVLASVFPCLHRFDGLGLNLI